MDPRTNPYAPGAGTPPPELAGRETLLTQASTALHRIRHGLAGRSLMLVGLRGVGKTVLLNRMHNDAEAAGCATVMLEAPEQRSLPALLAPSLRAALLKLDRLAAAGDLSKRALRALGSFVQATKIKFADIEFSVDLGQETGVADSGDLEADLTALLQALGEAAQQKKTVLALFIDELQFVAEKELAALVMALHRCGQRQLPVTLMAAGLPQLVGQLGNAKSYAERLFEFVTVGPLPDPAARQAIAAPAAREGVAYEDAALDEIVRQTQGYPYFLQEWGKHSWQCATASPITRTNVQAATVQALTELDQSFFRVRFDRLTPQEKKYLRAMAERGAGPHRSGDIANQLQRDVKVLAPLRGKLIKKGMVYSPAHGDTAFTVPLFDAFMKRVMPTL